MANLKDLIVRGVSRFIGKVYATDIEASGNIDSWVQNGTIQTLFWNFNIPEDDTQEVGLSVIDTNTTKVGGTVAVSPDGVFISSPGPGGTVIRNVNTPILDTDAANKKYVDDAIAAIPVYDGTVTG